MSDGFLHHLAADGPHPALGSHADLYGRFVGSWDIDNTALDETRGEWTRSAGEVHFAWVLAGRAIQDLWASSGGEFGTTLRVYDAALDAWRITWTHPANGWAGTMIGRAEDDGIVQIGTDERGQPIRWSFGEITADSFVWRGEAGGPGGTWRLVQEMHARRRGPTT